MAKDLSRQFWNIAKCHPDAVCVSEVTGGITFGELANDVSRLAQKIVDLGLPDRSVITLIFEPGSDYIAATLAVISTGHVFMPVNPDFPQPRIMDLVTRVQSPLCLVSQRFSSFAKEVGSALGARSLTLNAVSPEKDVVLLHVPKGAHERPRLDADACYVICTSGSTGKPKMILGSSTGLQHFVDWEIGKFSFGPSARCTFLSNISFDVSLRDIFPALLSGGTICVPAETTKKTPSHLVAWMEAERVTHVHIVPTLLRSLFAALPDDGLANRLPDLTFALIAGEPLFGHDVSNWRSRVNKRTQLVNLYGPSETTLAKLCYEINEEALDRNQMIPVGRPLPDTEVIVIDEQERECTTGQLGEILISTPYMSLGYLNAPDEQAANFAAAKNVVPAFGRAYRTGDLGRILESGDLKLEGRKDSQVKLYGNRVELAEVDVAIRQHPGVAHAAAAVKSDALGNQRLIGYFVPRMGCRPSTDDLKATVAITLPAYMVPSLFIALDSLPLTHSNKVDRSALPDAPKNRPVLQVEYAPATTALEKSLVDIWKEVLDLDDVGVADGFFDLGGTSMLALHLITKIHQEVGFDAPATLIFECPTVQQLAQHISGEPHDEDIRTRLTERANKRKAALRRRHPGSGLTET